MAEPWQTIAVLLIGLGMGVLSGMFGVGGAIVSTPAIRLLGATPIEAVASTLPSIFPSAVSGSLRYRRDNLIRGRIVLWTSLAGCGAAAIGALLTDVIPGQGHVLMLVTAAFVGFSAWRMATGGPRDVETAAAFDEARAEERDEWWRLVIIGVGAGLLSGLLGIGGGILMGPAFVSWVRMPLKEALATSLACVGVLAIPGTMTHTLLGHIDWAFAVPLGIGVIPGARLGASLTIKSSDHTLRLAVGSVLGAIAVVYAIGEVISILR